jgi:hypothetical protein
VFDRNNLDMSGEEHQLQQPETMTRQTPYGEVYRLAPPVEFSETPGHWEDPILTVRGSCKAEWVSRPQPKTVTRNVPQAAKRDGRRATPVQR